MGSQEPTNCSIAHYNPNKGGKDYSACQPCKGGYYCFELGIGNLFTYNDTYKCPSGSYCPPGAYVPYPCRAGTFSDLTLRFPPVDPRGCAQCPEHYYCPSKSSDLYAHPCKTGTYCPPGSSQPLLCPPGEFCLSVSNITSGLNIIQKGPCPEGYYCPIGTKVTIRCKTELGEVCKRGASFPSKTLQTSSICKPGEYFSFGLCNPCEEGFVCQNFTN